MFDHIQLTDATFEKQFATCKLSPSLFTHEAHLRLAWIHITKYGIKQALDTIQIQLQNFVAHANAADKYNKTLTIAATKAVYHFILQSKTTTFKEFITEHPRLLSNFRQLMEAHYSLDIFTSQRAKQYYISPDLLPFDC
ncbi:hypothetical protein KORDIASMS9_02518 [Kordia sp. SMS9]|uniref:hypothetical protein n=1 Tax=Kordia sp. SMS9 TaxID=2282170 RepID=UPI000E0DE690|nr:hypothetical protein [Kordia sp. SMS9]AXG70279.1 hypothetical protein KORDIASMS9_02518 [Kordia sp. SMS9]